MTTNEPPPYPGDQPEDTPSTSGLPSYGSTPPPPGDGGGYPPPPPGYGPPKTNTKAIWSLVLGILSFFCCGLVTGTVAIVLSRTSRSEILASQGSQTGLGLAKAGLITGIIGLVLWVVYIILVSTGVIDLEFYAESS